MEKLMYKQYLQTLANLFDYLEQHSQRAFASHDNAYHVLGVDGDRIVVNKQFRALYHLPSDKAKEVSKLIEQAENLYQQALQTNDEKQVKRPLYLPYMLDDDTIKTITLHANTAHSSYNYRGDDLVPVASVIKRLGINGVKNDVKKERTELIAQIKASGFNYTTEILDDKLAHEVFYIRARDLCQRYQCDSIQLRQATGKQYRYSIFSIDRNGYKTASKPLSLGVAVLVGNAQIIAPTQRKQRIDILDKQHPHAIHLNFIKDGTMYCKFNNK